MFSQKSKHIIAQVFLFTFILIKAAGLHAFMHKDNPDSAKKCVLCHLTSRENSTPLLSTDNQVDFVVFEKKIFAKVTNHYEVVASEKPETCQLFNKPPPFYTVS